MQTCKNCQSTLPDDARTCPYCGSPVQKDNDDARRRLMLRLRLVTLPSPLAATASAAPYVIASTLILGFVILGLFLRPPAVKSPPLTQPILIVTPLTLDFGKVVVGDKQTRTLTVKNSSGLSLHWTADTTKASWLKLDTSSGDLGPNAEKIVKATMDIDRLPPRPAPYSAIVSINANEMSTIVKTTVTIIAPGKLCVRPDHLNFGTLKQGTSGKLFVTVGDCGAQSLSWFIAAGKENWVSSSSTRGIIGPGGQQKVQVTVDTGQLTPSSTAYATSLTFGSDKGSKIVPITVTVSTQPPPLKRVPMWSVDQTNLDPGNSKCIGKGDTRTCTVTLTEDASSQENINWSLTSNLGATFNPPGGSLMPGGQQQVTISSIICQNDTFTFYGSEGETPILISWSCTLPCIKVDQKSLSITVMQGQPSTAQSVTFTNCGADMGNVSVLPTTIDGAPWLNLSSVNTESLNGPLAPGIGEVVSISVTSVHLQPGTYQGTISASLTTDTGTRTASTTITLTVSPCFMVNQSSLSFTSPGKDDVQEVIFTNCGTYTGDISISTSTSDGARWLVVTDSQTSGPLDAGLTDPVYVAIDLYHTKLVPGNYQGTISATLTTTNGKTTSAPVNVTLTVLSPPHMTVSPSSLDFSVQQGQTASKQLTIGNTGEQALSWKVQRVGVPWVILDTSSGTIPVNGGPQPIQVTVDASHLEARTYPYTATLTFNSNADNTPVKVTITLVVVPPPNMQVSTTNLSPTVCTNDDGTPTATTSSVTITNIGGGTLTWTVGTPSAKWLTVTPVNGSDGPDQPSTLNFNVDPVAWSNSDSASATVNITSPNGQSKTVTVTPAYCIP